jgi:SAM-dependent methyltransferase
VPSLFKQKTEMASQAVRALGGRKTFDGYAEIGSKGRYVRALAKQLDLRGPIYLIDEVAPTMSPVDILERGQIAHIGKHLPLSGFSPIPDALPGASLDLVSCFVGLHHMTLEQLGPFLASVHRVLRDGGAFLVRDHDVRDDDMRAIVSLAHTVFNAGLGESWKTNRDELRLFTSVDEWVCRLDAAGFDDAGCRILQDGDPTDNTLLLFVKRPATAASLLPDVRREVPA